MFEKIVLKSAGLLFSEYDLGITARDPLFFGEYICKGTKKLKHGHDPHVDEKREKTSRILWILKKIGRVAGKRLESNSGGVRSTCPKTGEAENKRSTKRMRRFLCQKRKSNNL